MSFKDEELAQDIVDDYEDYGIDELDHEKPGTIKSEDRKHDSILRDTESVLAEHDKERESTELDDKESSDPGGSGQGR